MSKKCKRTFGFKEEQFQKLLKVIKSTRHTNHLNWLRDYTIIHTLALTGLRLSECLGLKLDDLDFKNRIITVRAENNKLGEEQQIFMHERVAKQLVEFIKRKNRRFKDRYLFYSRKRNSPHIKRIHFGRIVRTKYLPMANLNEIHFIDKQGHARRKLRVHSLRKYFSTKLIVENPNMPLAIIAKATRNHPDVLYEHYLEVNEQEIQSKLLNKAFG